jgi:hypothetical protein
MTPQQEEAMKEVRKLMVQNFDSWLLTYSITNENLQTKINHDWHGNISDVVGLSSITQSRLLEYVSLRSTKAE